MDKKILIKQILVGPHQVFTYIVGCAETRESVLIDPAGETERLSFMVEKTQARIRYLIWTHGHADHTLAIGDMKARLKALTCMHEEDDRFFASKPNKTSQKDLGLPPPPPVDIRLKDGDILTVGELKIEVIHTPGHSPGSVCFYARGNLFTGDTLFVGAAGRTDLEGESLDTLLESIEKKISNLPPDTMIWPGHHYGPTPSSTIGQEMQENIYITDFLT